MTLANFITSDPQLNVTRNAATIVVSLPRGVTVALQILDLFVMVRIHARQPTAGWRTRVHGTQSQTRKDRHRRSIHARQPRAAWRIRVDKMRSHPGKGRPRRPIHARQPCAAWRTQVRKTRSHSGKGRPKRPIHARPQRSPMRPKSSG